MGVADETFFFSKKSVAPFHCAHPEHTLAALVKRTDFIIAKALGILLIVLVCGKPIPVMPIQAIPGPTNHIKPRLSCKISKTEL